MTASLAGYLASAGAPLYSAAKHGIVGLMRALKSGLATVNIAISVVALGITGRRSCRKSGKIWKRGTSPSGQLVCRS
jgi:NAD(P)-dependent dehydrogenase (short-subunit alcohol dehydrogenase family)